MTEIELIQGCIKENQLCQKALWDKYAPKLLTVCLRYLPSREEAEDTLMEGFVKILDHLHTFKGESALETWMRRIMVNSCLNKLRTLKITDSIDSDRTDYPNSDNVFAHLSAKELMQLIGKLPEGYKTVFNLFVIEGYTHKEIADTLKIEEATSRSQLNKARKALQEMITIQEKVRFI